MWRMMTLRPVSKTRMMSSVVTAPRLLESGVVKVRWPSVALPKAFARDGYV
jgi:hypothetical protein